MIVKTYTTESSSNTITKTLVDVADIDMKFKDTVDIINPEIILKYEDMIDFNYVYIAKFSRYYFVDSVEAYPNKIYRLSLRCDVLMSFKDEILASSGNITSQTNYNPYYNNNYSSEVRKESNIYYSKVRLASPKTTILCTIGGV